MSQLSAALSGEHADVAFLGVSFDGATTRLILDVLAAALGPGEP